MVVLWDDSAIDRMIIVLGAYFGIFPVVLVGWPAYFLGGRNYMSRPTSLSRRKGLKIALIPLAMLPLFTIPLFGLLVCTFLLHTIGRWKAEMAALSNTNGQVPAYLPRLMIVLALDVLFYALGMAFIFVIVFAMGAP